MIERMDVDGDGKLNKEEFEKCKVLAKEPEANLESAEEREPEGHAEDDQRRTRGGVKAPFDSCCYFFVTKVMPCTC